MKYNYIKIILFGFITAGFSLSAYSQAEGESEARTIIIRKSPEVASPEVNNTDTLTLEEENIEDKYHALIIGINNYQDPELLDLDNPIRDSESLYETLTAKYMFKAENVILLKNPTRADIIKQFDRLSSNLTEDENLVIFYAGHGSWDEKKETGYWLPSDADRSSSVNWLRNSTIKDFVEDINTRHTLLITDACFAGSLVVSKSREGFRDAPASINKLYALPSRKAMTSGTLKQVPDRSVFLQYLMKRLTENEKKYMSARTLFSSLSEAVLNNSPNVPQYRVIQNTGDEGGDFIFIRR